MVPYVTMSGTLSADLMRQHVLRGVSEHVSIRPLGLAHTNLTFSANLIVKYYLEFNRIRSFDLKKNLNYFVFWLTLMHSFWQLLLYINLSQFYVVDFCMSVINPALTS